MLEGWATRTWAEYQEGHDQAGDGRPLAGYAVLLSAYGTACVGLAVAVRRRRRSASPLGGPLRPLDVAKTGVAVFRLARTLTKDSVTSPLRAPFVTYLEPGGPGEVLEAPREGHVRHAVGELLTCPFCVSQWVATTAVAGWLLAPRVTRWVVDGMVVVAASDALQLAYGGAQELVE